MDLLAQHLVRPSATLIRAPQRSAIMKRTTVESNRAHSGAWRPYERTDSPRLLRRGGSVPSPKVRVGGWKKKMLMHLARGRGQTRFLVSSHVNGAIEERQVRGLVDRVYRCAPVARARGACRGAEC